MKKGEKMQLRQEGEEEKEWLRNLLAQIDRYEY
jgi:phosphotransferase system HPr-like phosphotransfer protein